MIKNIFDLIECWFFGNLMFFTGLANVINLMMITEILNNNIKNIPINQFYLIMWGFIFIASILGSGLFSIYAKLSKGN